MLCVLEVNLPFCLFFRRNYRELQRFMPSQLFQRWKRDAEVKDQLGSVFHKFYSPNAPANSDHLRSKYIEVYEKDEMCGTHIFKLKQVRERKGCESGRPDSVP